MIIDVINDNKGQTIIYINNQKVKSIKQSKVDFINKNIVLQKTTQYQPSTTKEEVTVIQGQTEQWGNEYYFTKEYDNHD